MNETRTVRQLCKAKTVSMVEPGRGASPVGQQGGANQVNRAVPGRLTNQSQDCGKKTKKHLCA